MPRPGSTWPSALAVAVPLLAVLASSLVTYVLTTSLRSFDELSSAKKTTRRKLRKSKRPEKPSIDADERPGEEATVAFSGLYPPGLNNCGNTCFMNSVLQAFASLPSLYAYLCIYFAFQQRGAGRSPEARPIQGPRDLMVPCLEPHDNGLIQALVAVLQNLLTLSRHRASFAPTDLIAALSRKAAWVSSRQQQDAQELFQILSAAMVYTPAPCDLTASLFDLAGLVDKLPQALNDAGPPTASLHLPAPTTGPRSPFLGLAAQRTSCIRCGYTAAVRHFTFDNLSLTLPMASRCHLTDLLREYTRLDTIDDFNCHRCAVRRTLAAVEAQLTDLTGTTGSGERKRRSRKGTAGGTETSNPKVARERLESQRGALVKALEENLPEDDPSFKGQFWPFAHVIGWFVLAVKNPCQIDFPSHLDLTPFVTSGHLSTQPARPLSSSSNRHHHPPAATAATRPAQPPTSDRSRFRLNAILSHGGTHAFGHFITYRRTWRPAVPTATPIDAEFYAGLLPPEAYRCLNPQPSEAWLTQQTNRSPGSSPAETARDPPAEWFRISDSSVEPCQLEHALAAGDAYMLFYELE
ncbi:ubiquitin-specific protease ubp1 [Tieghemiomyces parasiticus]|uniref:Ubiquitin carboxyl-terminal hydrolase n=1 Tax=Tieghemiomyces parasiticus TaxID=78921 RepID=A0A9W8A826_9FUNG|nr:ubiquitin-specific protease ubp1 [Tieghemiomyces parasiticus]